MIVQANPFVTDYSHAVDTTWTDVDLSTLFAGNAGSVAGVLIQFVNESGGALEVGLRKNGSSDDIRDDLQDGYQIQMAVGVDSGDILEMYLEDASALEAYVVGWWTTAEAEFLTTAQAITPAGISAWTSTDLSTYFTGTVLGAACWIKTGSSTNFGIRDDDGVEDRYATVFTGTMVGTIVPATSEAIDCYRASLGTFYVVGAMTDNFTKFTETTGTLNNSSWTDVTFANASADAVAVLGQWHDGSGSDAAVGRDSRADGQSTTELHICSQENHWVSVCGAAQAIDAYVGTNNVEIYAVAEFTEPEAGGSTHDATASLSLPSLEATGTATHVPPGHDGTASPILPALTASGTATHAIAERQATSALPLPALAATGTATHVSPQSEATAALLLPALAATGTATHVPPGHDATAALNLPALTASGTATHALSPSSATASPNLPALTASGTATHAIAERQATAALDLPALTASGTATHAASPSDAAAAVSLPALTASGTATHAIAERQATASLSLPALGASGTATHALSPSDGTANLALPALTASGTATHAISPISATASASLPSLTASGTATHAGPEVSATASLALPALGAAGTATFEPPPAAATGAQQLPALTAAGTATFVKPEVQATAALQLPSLQMSGTATPFGGGFGYLDLPSLEVSGTAVFVAAPLLDVDASIKHDLTIGASLEHDLDVDMGASVEHDLDADAEMKDQDDDS